MQLLCGASVAREPMSWPSFFWRDQGTVGSFAGNRYYSHPSCNSGLLLLNNLSCTVLKFRNKNLNRDEQNRSVFVNSFWKGSLLGLNIRQGTTTCSITEHLSTCAAGAAVILGSVHGGYFCSPVPEPQLPASWLLPAP